MRLSSKRVVARSLFWCSAVCLLAACGGSTVHRAHDPFAYTPGSLAERDEGIVMSSKAVAVHTLSFAGANGSRVLAFLLVPRTPGKHAAVLFLHGSGGTREDLLLPAAQLAARGAVTMTISQPNDAVTFRPLVVNARRALDLLVAHADVDPQRLGLVGFSLGAQTAAILAGDEPRLKAVGIVAGRGSATPLYWIGQAHADLYFQAGTHDERVSRAQIRALIRAAPGHPRVSWYDTGHGMNRRSFADQVQWQSAELRLR